MSLTNLEGAVRERDYRHGVTYSGNSLLNSLAATIQRKRSALSRETCVSSESVCSASVVHKSLCFQLHEYDDEAKTLYFMMELDRRQFFFKYNICTTRPQDILKFIQTRIDYADTNYICSLIQTQVSSWLKTKGALWNYSPGIFNLLQGPSESLVSESSASAQPSKSGDVCPRAPSN